MIFSCSDFIDGCEEFAGLHCSQALLPGWDGDRPARAKEAGLGDAGDGDSIELVAAEHVKMRVVLSHRETHMAARPA